MGPRHSRTIYFVDRNLYKTVSSTTGICLGMSDCERPLQGRLSIRKAVVLRLIGFALGGFPL